MEPKGRLPLSKNDKLAAVDAELESALERLTETNERIDRVLTNLEEEPDSSADAEVPPEMEAEPNTDSSTSEPEPKTS